MRGLKRYIYGGITAIAIVGMLGIFWYSHNKQQEQQAKEKTESEYTEQESLDVSGIVEPKEEISIEEEEPKLEDESARNIEEEAYVPASTTPDYRFTSSSELLWPIQGNVIMNYSMDQTTYFETIDAYKYMPAILIQANVNDEVKVAATGKITQIYTNEETGLTVVMDIGGGYELIYGQLKNITAAEGDVVFAGTTLAYIEEPTKYFIKEGANLYFRLNNDQNPENPMVYLSTK